MKPSTLLLFLILTAKISSAQDWTDNKFKFEEIYPGYIVPNEGDTVRGYVRHPYRQSAQESVMFYTDASKKEAKKYKPKDLKAYGVADKEYRSVAYSAGLMKQSQRFLLLLQNGRISQYLHYTSKDGINIRGPQESAADYDARITTDEIVWQKLDESPIGQQSLILGFAKKFSKLLSDYPELAEKVENKDKGYGLLNVNKIVEEYNTWWQKK